MKQNIVKNKKEKLNYYNTITKKVLKNIKVRQV